MVREQTVTPYMCVRGAEAAIQFYKDVFGARELFRLTDPGDGRIGHAELVIGGAEIYIADEYPDFGALGPDAIGGTPVTLHLSVTDCDVACARAEAAGAIVLRRPADQFFGERTAQIQDPWGHRWFLAQWIEDVTPETMQARWNGSAG
ncbi:VOC family protein [Arenibacterium halophilum]|uniref:VOC family protein n=1 Tax=Arenibacterium halophilum TaxID=2583821 RepID=A0ABY2XBX4_9RHOB|nr:VOC family protein [Arenibacterium halophilum]TMV14459.1 VOC family protein [Arenibacterium halophilum]